MLETLKERFLDYHRAQGFSVYPSFPLVAKDPTVLFTNATVTPFKSMFMGVQERQNYALVQRCLRLGGTGGDIESHRSNTNYASLFNMLGSGLFDVDHNVAVAYFVDVLTMLGLQKEDLLFTALTDGGFGSALVCAGISTNRIRLFFDSKEIQHEWSFGEGDLHGHGVIAWYVPKDHADAETDTVQKEFARYVQIGRVVHLDGLTKGCVVEKFAYHAYDMGIGLGRVEVALRGDSEESLHRWRVVSGKLQAAMRGLCDADAHYMANLCCVVESLIGEGLLPGKKRQSYVLRKLTRSLIEEIWLASGSLIDTSPLLRGVFDESRDCESCVRVVAQEEAALRSVLSAAERRRRTHQGMSSEELRATFGIRPSLLGLQR